MLAAAIVLITLALVSYTTGIFAEQSSGLLKVWHAIAFGIGLVFDATGTFLMSLIAGRSDKPVAATQLSQSLNTLMAATGAAALILMAVHLIWAIVVLVRDRESEKRTFHKFSLIVWLIWLVPYITGAAAAMLG